MARRIELERRSTGGLEASLDFAAVALLVAGITVAGVFLIWWRFDGVLPATGLLVNAALSWLLLRSVAEIIRLLKHQNGLPYSGKISAAGESSLYFCSDCDALLHSETRCDSCGATIETDQSSDTTALK